MRAQQDLILRLARHRYSQHNSLQEAADLITRSAGFGYFGSVITSIIFAGFTFIFFALEGSIMAQGLLVGLGIPLWMGYLIATLMVLPLVVYGMKALTRLQVWTTPLWLVLMVVPVVWLIVKDPQLVDGFLHFAGKNSASTVDITAIMLGAGVCLSLIMQIGEQIDYLRFMPPNTTQPGPAEKTASHQLDRKSVV